MAPSLRATKAAAAVVVDDDDSSATPKKKRKASSVKKTTPVEKASPKKAKKATKAKAKAKTADSAASTPAKKAKKATKAKKESPESPSPKKKAAPKHQVLTERDEIPKLWDSEKAKKNGSYTFKIASWNVAGLRALMRNHPNALADLVVTHDLDVLCLQETKLQEIHVDDPKLKIKGHLLEEQGYDSYYTCSTAKKGYSGTAVFVRRRQAKGEKTKKKQTTVDSFFAPAVKKETTATAAKKQDVLPIKVEELIPEEVSFRMGKDKHDAEGRMVVVDFPSFSFCNVYVPNSGQKLERLSYRTEEWDTDFLAFLQSKQKDRGLPVMWLGDLNVAHTNLEVWNDGAKHLAKQAGVTAEERASFQAMLDAGFVDAFRGLHPEAKGHYSYWSQRAGNRGPNKGLRLDYFMCDPLFFDESSSKVVARDSYVLFDQLGSDHCPVVLELEIKP